MMKIDEYINKINLKKEKKQIKEEVIFGQTTGAMLMILFAFMYCNTTDTKAYDTIYITMIIIGAILLLIGLIYPNALYYPNKLLKKIFNTILNFIMSAILFVIYIIYIIPSSLIMKKKYKNEYSFCFWKNDEIPISNGYEKIETQDNKIDISNNRGKEIFNIFSYFYQNGHYLLLPIIFLLILLGLLFFFMTSSVIAPMIYPLF